MRQNLKKILAYFSTKTQLNKTIEELAELQVELFHLKDNKVPTKALISEMADVLIMLDQLMLMYDISSDVFKTYKTKVNRTLKRIEQGYYKR